MVFEYLFMENSREAMIVGGFTGQDRSGFNFWVTSLVYVLPIGIEVFPILISVAENESMCIMATINDLCTLMNRSAGRFSVKKVKV